METSDTLIPEKFILGRWNAAYPKHLSEYGSGLEDSVYENVVDWAIKSKELTKNDSVRKKILDSYFGDENSKRLLYKKVIENKDTEEGRLVAGFMMNRLGVAMFLDHVKQISSDQSLEADERKNANDFLLSFWDGIVPIRKGEVVLDWNRFYTEIQDDFHPMTEAREGDRRTVLLIEKLTELGISKNDLVLDVGSGNGWLTRRLGNQNFKVVGFEANDKYLEEAKQKGGRYVKGDFRNLDQEVKKARLKPVVEIVNGRTIMHLKEKELIGLRAPVVIFDCLDPKTGIAKERLDKFREKLTQYGFDKAWLDENFWNLLGTIDQGDHLAERLALPEERFAQYFERRGYSVQVLREEDYDNNQTDNLVYICTKDDYYPELPKRYIYHSNNTRTDTPSDKFYTGLGYAVFGY